MADLALAFEEEELYTYRDYKAWELKPDERYEMIYGVAYAMAAPNITHQRILVSLTLEIGNFLKGKPCEVFTAPVDVRLFYEEDESDDTVVQPDLLVICDKEKVGFEGIHGAPELAVEILSPSNTAIEMERKLILYKEAGIKEYWIVDPKNKTISLHLLENNRYVMQSFGIEDSVQSRVLSGLTIPLAGIFENVEPEPDVQMDSENSPMSLKRR